MSSSLSFCWWKYCSSYSSLIVSLYATECYAFFLRLYLDFSGSDFQCLFLQLSVYLVLSPRYSWLFVFDSLFLPLRLEPFLSLPFFDCVSICLCLGLPIIIFVSLYVLLRVSLSRVTYVRRVLRCSCRSKPRLETMQWNTIRVKV